jgi:putative ABC transport system permease protein
MNEANSGANVIVLGSEIASSLWSSRTNGKRKGIRSALYRDWVLKKQGAPLFAKRWYFSFIPVNFLRQLYGDNNESLVNVIVLKPNKVSIWERIRLK